MTEGFREKRVRGEDTFLLSAGRSKLERKICRYDSMTLIFVGMIVALTNAFWLVMGALGRPHINLNYGITGTYVAAMVAGSVVIMLISAAKYQSFITDFWFSVLAALYFAALIGEVTCLSVALNVQLEETGQSTTGLALSSLYLFCLVFVPLYRHALVALECICVSLSLFIPLWTRGAENYNFAVNAVMIAMVIFSLLCYRFVLVSMFENSNKLENEGRRYARLTRECLETVSNTIDAKSNYLHGHSKHVAVYARAIAAKMNLSVEQQNEVYLAGLLHDVGKIGVPDSILDKPGRLTDEEFDVIKRHVLDGYDILNNMTEFHQLAEAAKWHHEYFDGRGYPGGLSGEDIPLYSRIICVADSFDAMSKKRPYKPARPREEVIAEIERCRGTQFDPVVADVMLDLLRTDMLPSGDAEKTDD